MSEKRNSWWDSYEEKLRTHNSEHIDPRTWTSPTPSPKNQWITKKIFLWTVISIFAIGILVAVVDSLDGSDSRSDRITTTCVTNLFGDCRPPDSYYDCLDRNTYRAAEMAIARQPFSSESEQLLEAGRILDKELCGHHLP